MIEGVPSVEPSSTTTISISSGRKILLQNAHDGLFDVAFVVIGINQDRDVRCRHWMSNAGPCKSSLRNPTSCSQISAQPGQVYQIFILPSEARFCMLEKMSLAISGFYCIVEKTQMLFALSSFA